MAFEASIRQRLAYGVDRFLSRGSSALFISLTISFLGALLLFGTLRALATLLERLRTPRCDGLDRRPSRRALCRRGVWALSEM